MLLLQFIYTHEGCPLPTCEVGNYELSAGEQVEVTLDPKNPEWTPVFVADVVAVERTSTGRNYTIEYDDEVIGASGIMFEGCDIKKIEPYCCCDDLDRRVTDLEARVDSDVHVLEGQTVIPDASGMATIQVVDAAGNPLAPVNLNLNSLLDNTDDRVVPNQLLTPSVGGIVVIAIEDQDGNALDPVTIDLSSLIDTFSQLIPNQNNTASFITNNGSMGPCVITCPPTGAAPGTIPKHDGNGGILWEDDDNTEYSFTFNRAGDALVVDIDDNQGGDIFDNILEDVFLDTDTIDVSQFTGSVLNGIVTIAHNAAGNLTALSFPVGISDINTVSNANGSTTISYIDGAGNTQIAGVIPPDLSGMATDNNNGTNSTNFPDGSSTCSISCPPAGAAAGTIPRHDGNGGIIWDQENNTTYSFSRNGDDLIVTASDGSPSVTIEDVFLDTNTVDVSQFSASTMNGVITLNHTSNGISTPVQIPLGISSIEGESQPDGSTIIRYVDGAGNTQIAGVIAADDDSVNVTTSTDANGQDTFTHVPSNTTWTVENVTVNSTLNTDAYVGQQPTSAPPSPVEGDTHIETFTMPDGIMFTANYVYDEDSSAWIGPSIPDEDSWRDTFVDSSTSYQADDATNEVLIPVVQETQGLPVIDQDDLIIQLRGYQGFDTGSHILTPTVSGNIVEFEGQELQAQTIFIDAIYNAGTDAAIERDDLRYELYNTTPSGNFVYKFHGLGVDLTLPPRQNEMEQVYDFGEVQNVSISGEWILDRGVIDIRGNARFTGDEITLLRAGDTLFDAGTVDNDVDIVGSSTVGSTAYINAERVSYVAVRSAVGYVSAQHGTSTIRSTVSNTTSPNSFIEIKRLISLNTTDSAIFGIGEGTKVMATGQYIASASNEVITFDNTSVISDPASFDINGQTYADLVDFLMLNEDVALSAEDSRVILETIVQSGHTHVVDYNEIVSGELNNSGYPISHNNGASARYINSRIIQKLPLNGLDNTFVACRGVAGSVNDFFFNNCEFVADDESQIFAWVNANTMARFWFHNCTGNIDIMINTSGSSCFMVNGVIYEGNNGLQTIPLQPHEYTKIPTNAYVY